MLDLFTPADAIEEQWRTFHREHPEVYVKLVELARVRLRMGHEKGSAKQLFEALRWNARPGELPQLNNNFTALYAREIMRREPDLGGFFETRKRKDEAA